MNYLSRLMHENVLSENRSLLGRVMVLKCVGAATTFRREEGGVVTDTHT